jgi:hypothetical protein
MGYCKSHFCLSGLAFFFPFFLIKLHTPHKPTLKSSLFARFGITYASSLLREWENERSFRQAPTDCPFRFGEDLVYNVSPVLGRGLGVGRAMGDLQSWDSGRCLFRPTLYPPNLLVYGLTSFIAGDMFCFFVDRDLS